MSKQLLRKVYKPGKRSVSMLAASAGFTIGLLFVLLAVQFYLDIQQALQKAGGRKGLYDVQIVYKKVKVTNSLSLFDNSFSARFNQEDLNVIRNFKGVHRAEPFRLNTFKFSTDLNEKLNIYADLFFESVPDEFLDTIPEGWNWRIGDTVVPVMMSRDFLDLYNFNVTLLYDLPQVSPEVLREIPLHLTLNGYGKTKPFEARIVGFSQRVPSIIIPDSFMQWANTNFGNGPHKTISKVAVQLINSSNPDWLHFLEEHKMETRNETPKNGIMKQAASLVLSLGSVMGIVFTALSILIFVLTLQLSIARSKRELSLLIMIGYPPPILTKNLFNFLLRYALGSTITAFVLFILLHFGMSWWMNKLSVESTIIPHYLSFLAGLLLFFLALLVNYFSIRRSVFDCYNSGSANIN